MGNGAMVSESSDEKETILIIEDESALQSLITEFLGDDSYAFVLASSCAEARQRMKSARFSCALVDLGLPDGNGLSLLPEIKAAHPICVPMIFTSESRLNVVVEAMRAGAFDYLMKPINYDSVKVAVERAVEHHKALKERDRLLALLSEEREQLARRVEEATADIRQYADHCQMDSARRQSIIKLTQASSDYYTDERQFRQALEETAQHAPVVCVALCSHATREFIAALRDENQEVVVISSEIPAVDGFSTVLSLEELMTDSVGRYTSLNPAHLRALTYPLTFWGRTSCVVGFYLEPEPPIDQECEEFLRFCANILAMEWREAQLFLHASEQATLGGVAMELFKGVAQALTAIQMAADIIGENDLSEETGAAVKIIQENTGKINRSIQEFQRLSAPQKGSVKTVSLPECVDQALGVVTLSKQYRHLTIVKRYEAPCECVLLNMEMLVRTLVDVVATAIALADDEGGLELRLAEEPPAQVVFELRFQGKKAEWFDMAALLGQSPLLDSRIGPAFMLAQRVIQRCAGKLLVEYPNGGTAWKFRIELPQNALTHSPIMTGSEGG